MSVIRQEICHAIVADPISQAYFSRNLLICINSIINQAKCSKTTILPIFSIFTRPKYDKELRKIRASSLA